MQVGSCANSVEFNSMIKNQHFCINCVFTIYLYCTVATSSVHKTWWLYTLPTRWRWEPRATLWTGDCHATADALVAHPPWLRCECLLGHAEEHCWGFGVVPEQCHGWRLGRPQLHWQTATGCLTRSSSLRGQLLLWTDSLGLKMDLGGKANITDNLEERISIE